MAFYQSLFRYSYCDLLSLVTLKKHDWGAFILDGFGM